MRRPSGGLASALAVGLVVLVAVVPSGSASASAADGLLTQSNTSQLNADGERLRLDSLQGQGGGSGSSGSGQRVYGDCQEFRESWGRRHRGGGRLLREVPALELSDGRAVPPVFEQLGRVMYVNPVAGERFWLECRHLGSGQMSSWLVDPDATAGPVAAELVAHQALAEVDLELPEIRTSPPRGGRSVLVGPPVWFWVDDPQVESVTAEVPGLSATLTAEPVRLRVDATPLGDRGRVEGFECDGTGEPWELGVNGGWEASECSIAFDWNDTYQVDATVVWALSWTASNGESGTLADIERTSSFTLRVYQAQAVTD